MIWPLDQFISKDVVFVGVGQGRSIEGFKKFITSNCAIKSFNGVDKQTGDSPLSFLKDYDLNTTIFVKNEGIPLQEMPVPYVTPINIFFECAKALDSHTVGITGTKGKSTTSALTASMLREAGINTVLGGNIGEFGESLFDKLTSADKDTVFVVELSSYQLADIKHSPNVAACINLFNDHADWHGSKADYWAAKSNIIAHSQPNDLFVYNPNFQELADWAKDAKCQTVAIDANETIDMSSTALYGEHNRLNALAARRIARYFGVDDITCQKALDKFNPLPHRMEYVDNKNGHIFIDDAIGMTPESSLASIEAVANKYGQIGCIFLGGQDRGYDFTALMQKIADLDVACVAFFPDTVAKMKAAMPANYSPEIYETTSLDDAVKWASQHAPKDSVILMSMAAPSYSLWSGFPEKGDKFKAAVGKL